MFLARNYLETDGRWTRQLLNNIEIFIVKIEQMSYPCEAYLVTQIKKICLNPDVVRFNNGIMPLNLINVRHTINYVKYYFVRVAYCLMREKSSLAAHTRHLL